MLLGPPLALSTMHVLWVPSNSFSQLTGNGDASTLDAALVLHFDTTASSLVMGR